MARLLRFALVVSLCAWRGSGAPSARAQEAAPSAEEKAVAGVMAELTKAFNDGKADELVALFLPTGEIVDEDLNIHSGAEGVGALVGSFFERFPGAKITLDTETVRAVSKDLLMAEVCRTTTLSDGTDRAKVRSSVALARDGDKWRIASIRDEPADDELTLRERLEPLAWMVGEWVDEGPDSLVELNCRWSPGESFLLIDYKVTRDGQVAMNSHQRIGWDPLTQKVHSWMFDSDGGYGEADWTRALDRWLVKSRAVMPEGVTGSSTFAIEPLDKNRFVMRGFDRVLGEELLPDVEVTVVRKAARPAAKPAATKQAGR